MGDSPSELYAAVVSHTHLNKNNCVFKKKKKDQSIHQAANKTVASFLGMEGRHASRALPFRVAEVAETVTPLCDRQLDSLTDSVT